MALMLLPARAAYLRTKGNAAMIENACTYLASIYSPEGRRMTARIHADSRPAAAPDGDILFCDAQLEDVAAVYADDIICRTELKEAALQPTKGGWSLSDNLETPLSAARLADGDCSEVRGIYALAAQAVCAPVRAARRVWTALAGRWTAMGWNVYLFKREGRALAYGVFGRAGRTAYELAILPDAGIAPADVLRAAYQAGICAAEVELRGSHICL